jgi:hypothetical protein
VNSRRQIDNYIIFMEYIPKLKEIKVIEFKNYINEIWIYENDNKIAMHQLCKVKES